MGFYSYELKQHTDKKRYFKGFLKVDADNTIQQFKDYCNSQTDWGVYN